MQIEHVAGIGFAARRAAQQERHLAIGDGLFRQVVIDDDGVHAVVAEIFAHGAAGERRQILHRRRIGRGRRDHDRIVERALLFEHLDELRDRRALLPDRDIDAVELDLLVAGRVERLLIEDGVERDRGLAGLAVADDQLAMALSPVAIGSCTDLRGMMPGALTSTRAFFSALIGPLPSIGSPSASTTRPRSPFPTGTSTMARVRLTVWPSLISRSEPKITMPTLSTSRFSAMPLTPDSNSTISPACTLSRP